MALDRIEPGPELHDGFRSTTHLDDLRIDPEEPAGPRQPVIMREHDDLPRASRVLERPRESVDACRIHRLHRIVDHHETERALRQRRTRHEETEREGVELSLTHDSKCGALHAVDRHLQDDLAGRAGTGEHDLLELDVALHAQRLPDALGDIGDGREPLVADLGRRCAQPFLRRLQVVELGFTGFRLLGDVQPPRELGGDRPPDILARLQFLGRRLSYRFDLAQESGVRGPQMFRQRLGVIDGRARSP